ncbi:unnamed protein product [Linum trigynum]|uniref:Uncharacterized protein n=1 Tax=Linum trigynum TaxID=586398 RepID=A0AAV2EPR0_9ROSI
MTTISASGTAVRMEQGDAGDDDGDQDRSAATAGDRGSIKSTCCYCRLAFDLEDEEGRDGDDDRRSIFTTAATPSPSWPSFARFRWRTEGLRLGIGGGLGKKERRDGYSVHRVYLGFSTCGFR